MFRLKLNGQDVSYDHFTFPGGEEHVRIKKPGVPATFVQEVEIFAHVKSSSELVQLALLVDAIRGLSNVGRRTEFTLELPYLPYARQDRRCNWGEPLSTSWIGGFINGLQMDKVIIKDPHSNVSDNVISNIQIIPQDAIVREYLSWFIRQNDAVLVAPDAGAAKKIEALSKSLGGVPIIYGHKHRDLKTGEVTGVSIDNPGLVEDRYLVVVDDICDGGRTFTELGKVLSEEAPRHMTLFVTHGIFSKGMSVFDGIYDMVYADTIWWDNITADGIPNEPHLTTKGRLK